MHVMLNQVAWMIKARCVRGRFTEPHTRVGWLLYLRGQLPGARHAARVQRRGTACGDVVDELWLLGQQGFHMLRSRMDGVRHLRVAAPCRCRHAEPFHLTRTIVCTPSQRWLGGPPTRTVLLRYHAVATCCSLCEQQAGEITLPLRRLCSCAQARAAAAAARRQGRPHLRKSALGLGCDSDTGVQ